jgi:hypothetical protein
VTTPNGFEVDPGALRVTAEGVQGVLDELGRLGMNGQQASGSPVTALKLSSADVGDDLIATTLGTLLDRAHYVYRELIGNAEQTVHRLTTNATHYEDVENQIVAKFQDLRAAVIGAPAPRSAK